MKLAGAPDHHAAVAVVRGDLLTLPFARHHVGAKSATGVVGADLARLLGIVARREGAADAAIHPRTALNSLALDHGLDLAERIGGVAQHARHHLFPLLGIAANAFAREALAERRPAADSAAVAGACAIAEGAAFQHSHFDA